MGETLTLPFTVSKNYGTILQTKKEKTMNWKKVKEFDMYMVSDCGEIKSLRKGNLLKLESTKEGKYKRVTFSKNGKTTRFQVHRLVATHFIDNPDNKPHINHIDNNGNNNTIENLEWCTHSENMIHAQKQGRLFASQKKGGLASGDRIADLKLEEYRQLEGTTINNWTFIGNISTGLTKSRKNYLGVFRCSCGTEVRRHISSIFTGKSNGCLSCRKRKVKI